MEATHHRQYRAVVRVHCNKSGVRIALGLVAIQPVFQFPSLLLLVGSSETSSSPVIASHGEPRSVHQPQESLL
ncbi:hypothetical protein O9929_06185 [Vibrio lentus]|nr:hypothetical protein [Vibrio lentus]